MPKNRGPGGKGRKRAKGSGASTRDTTLLVAAAVDEDAALYAFVREVNGHGHYRVFCNDGKERLGVLRGCMKRRVWVRCNDVVLVTTRDYQDGKADIVHKYGSDEVLRLMAMGEIGPALSRMYNSFDAGVSVVGLGGGGGTGGGTGGAGSGALERGADADDDFDDDDDFLVFDVDAV